MIERSVSQSGLVPEASTSSTLKGHNPISKLNDTLTRVHNNSEKKTFFSTAIKVLRIKE